MSLGNSICHTVQRQENKCSQYASAPTTSLQHVGEIERERETGTIVKHRRRSQQGMIARWRCVCLGGGGLFSHRAHFLRHDQHWSLLRFQLGCYFKECILKHNPVTSAFPEFLRHKVILLSFLNNPLLE